MAARGEQMYIPPIDVDAITEIRKAGRHSGAGKRRYHHGGRRKADFGANRLRGREIGRGALGDPWLFERINAVLTGQPEPANPA